MRRTDAEAETPVLWPPHVKSWLIGKDPDAGRDWRQEEKGTTEDEMAGWHHQLDGREFEWTPGVGDGQGGLTCCDSWGRKELDMTEWLNSTELNENEPFDQNCYVCLFIIYISSLSYHHSQFSYWGLCICPFIYLNRLLLFSCFRHVQLFMTPWTVAQQTPLSRGFSRQEYWSG